MHDLIQDLYQFPPFYGATGFVAGIILLNLRGRGDLAWSRNLFMALIIPSTAAVIGLLVARVSPDYGAPVVLQTWLAAWAWAWALFGLLALWRNNIVVAMVLDRFLVFGGVAALLSAGFVHYMVYDVSHPEAKWAYAAVPLLAGALYRLLLVVLYLRAPLNEREALGARIERGLGGLWENPFLKRTEGAASPPLTGMRRKAPEFIRGDVRRSGR